MDYKKSKVMKFISLRFFLKALFRAVLALLKQIYILAQGRQMWRLLGLSKIYQAIQANFRVA